MLKYTEGKRERDGVVCVVWYGTHTGKWSSKGQRGML